MGNYHILVVDDDPLVCKGLKFNLEQSGYKVSTASTAHTALELSSRHIFDAAILDIGLPDDNGLDLCKTLRIQKDMPVIFLTARRRELDEIVGLEIGADDYITKPFSADILLAHLRAVLRRTSKPIIASPPMIKPIKAGIFELIRLHIQRLKMIISLILLQENLNFFTYFYLTLIGLLQAMSW